LITQAPAADPSAAPRRSPWNISKKDPERHLMKIITYYLALVLASDVVAVFLCLAIEKVWPAASLPVFLSLYFAILWGAWIAAVRLTEPQVASVATKAAQPAE
jgi:hypothetical protein